MFGKELWRYPVKSMTAARHSNRSGPTQTGGGTAQS